MGNEILLMSLTVSNSHLTNEQEKMLCFGILPIAVFRVADIGKKKKKAQSFESRYLLEISSIDPGTRIQIKTVSEFIVKILQIHFVQIFPASGIPDYQLNTGLTST